MGGGKEEMATTEAVIGGGALGTLQQLLSTLVLIITLGFLVAAVWTAYQKFSCGNGEPSDPCKHRCRTCAKEFRCRTKVAGVKLDEKGQIIKTMPRRQGINSFERKTVHVGSLPIEVSNPSHNKACCAVLVNSGLERFCTYQCYRSRLKQVSNSSGTQN